MDAAQALDATKRLYTKLVDRRREVEELDDYVRGKQPLTFASEQWAEFHEGRYKGFSDNWCYPVASAASERIALIGVRAARASKRSLSTLWDDWNRNDGDAQSSQGFFESIVAKRSFTIVWGDDDDGPEFTWEHPSQVIVGYAANNARRKTAALKSWVDGETEFATLYEPEALWKWSRKAPAVTVTNGVTDGGLHVVGSSSRYAGPDDEWEPYRPPEDDTWPLPNPLGEVNVIEWPNRPMLGNEPISDIAGTKAMQDAVNLLWAYLFGAADQASLPGRVVLGQDAPKVPLLDETGQKVGERPVDIKDLRNNRFLWLTGQDTKIDEFSRASLDVFTAVIEQAIAHIAAQTRTPSHYLINSGNVPAAGYELAEAGLVEKVKEFHLFSQAPARDHFRLMAKARGDERLAEALRSATLLWEPAGIRSDAQMADALLKKRQIGYPFAYLLELEGVSPDRIEQIMQMVRDEQSDPYLARLNAKEAADVGAGPSVDGL